MSDLRSARVICNSNPEMLHKHHELLRQLPKETEVIRFSSVRGIWEYTRANADCVFLADSLQSELAPGTTIASGFKFVPFADDHVPTKLGLIRVRQGKRSPEAAELIHTLTEAFAKLSARTSE